MHPIPAGGDGGMGELRNAANLIKTEVIVISEKADGSFFLREDEHGFFSLTGHCHTWVETRT